MEDLNTKGLARGMLAKSVHNAAWATSSAWSATRPNGPVAGPVLVDPRGTVETCPECGAVAAKTLAQREHHCECGCALDRDVAVAREILRRADFRPGTGLGAPSERAAA